MFTFCRSRLIQPNVSRSYLNVAKTYCVTSSSILSESEFEKVADETLERLSDQLDHLLEKSDLDSDISLNSGVLTINLGSRFGVYVINKQTPNKQIWLSSPVSGPKRFDYEIETEGWRYKREGVTLSKLLEDEFSKILKSQKIEIK